MYESGLYLLKQTHFCLPSGCSPCERSDLCRALSCTMRLRCGTHEQNICQILVRWSRASGQVQCCERDSILAPLPDHWHSVHVCMLQIVYLEVTDGRAIPSLFSSAQVSCEPQYVQVIHIRGQVKSRGILAEFEGRD